MALTYNSSKHSIDTLVEELISSRPNQSQTNGFEGSVHDAAGSNNHKISVHQADMANSKDLERLYEQIYQEHGRYPDILVANAGHGNPIPMIEDISLEEFDHTLTVNLRSGFLLCKLAIPHMKAQQWGRIVFIGSISGHGGGINGCHYAASKAGLMGMVKNLATKIGKDGISINDVAPAMIGSTGLIPDAKRVQGTPGDVQNIPVRRLGAPDEVANVVTMLCKTGYLTGQSILLSGGLK